jgi:hypothetical protein
MVTFTDEECAVLASALDSYLPQLRFERARADVRSAKHKLSLLEEALEAIRKRLEAADAVGQATGAPI